MTSVIILSQISAFYSQDIKSNKYWKYIYILLILYDFAAVVLRSLSYCDIALQIKQQTRMNNIKYKIVIQI